MLNQRDSLKVTHNRVGRDPEEFITEVTYAIHGELQDALKDTADNSAEIMQEVIKSSGYKLEKLASAIKAVVVDSTGGIVIDIGEIATFPKGEDGKDYWNAFNDGWLPPPNFGYFGEGNPPEAGKSGESWTHTKKQPGSYWMHPTKIIRPLKFAEIGHEALVTHIKSEIDKYLRSVK